MLETIETLIESVAETIKANIEESGIIEPNEISALSEIIRAYADIQS